MLPGLQEFMFVLEGQTAAITNDVLRGLIYQGETFCVRGSAACLSDFRTFGHFKDGTFGMIGGLRLSRLNFSGNLE
jgi:hypothetical protein